MLPDNNGKIFVEKINKGAWVDKKEEKNRTKIKIIHIYISNMIRIKFKTEEEEKGHSIQFVWREIICQSLFDCIISIFFDHIFISYISYKKVLKYFFFHKIIPNNLQPKHTVPSWWWVPATTIATTMSKLLPSSALYSSSFSFFFFFYYFLL